VLVACPHCGVQLNVPEGLLGKKVRCAKCSTVIETQALPPSPPDPEPSPSSPRANAAPAPEPEAELPEAALEDDAPYDLQEDRRERQRSRWQADDDDSDDRREPRRRRRRRIRRDLVPHRGATVLTLGILSIVASVICSVLCSIIGPLMGAGLGLPAVLLGHADLRQITGGNMDPDGESQTRTGMILGYVGLGLSLVAFLLCGVYLVVMLSTNRFRGY
jgi:predicted Zn finger-like uncharacterized protein